MKTFLNKFDRGVYHVEHKAGGFLDKFGKGVHRVEHAINGFLDDLFGRKVVRRDVTIYCGSVRVGRDFFF